MSKNKVMAPEEISADIWEAKYKFKDDATWSDTVDRVAKACASVETEPAEHEQAFADILQGMSFIPGGRIISNAGTGRETSTLMNCYVLRDIGDSMEDIFQTVKDAALTQQRGGGIGFDISSIRPKGSPVGGCGSTASGPVSFLHVFDATCKTIMSAGMRRGASLVCLRCDHPDIEEFITAKRGTNALTQFNMSVGITDAFIEAVRGNKKWNLVFGGQVHKTVKAAELWDTIMRSTYDYAEPGVLFLDRINERNSLYFMEILKATNPCAEEPLPPNGACLLGSINLTQFVAGEFFTPDAQLDYDGIRSTVATAVRMLDNCIDISDFALEAQREEARMKRRMGLGITGLADMLLFLGLRYDSDEGVATGEEVMREITHAAYVASVALAREKGCCPALESREAREKYVAGPYFKEVDHDGTLAAAILEHGIRNTHLTCVAPTGTTSMLAGNVSSGIEPVFAWEYHRKIRTGRGDETREVTVRDYAYNQYRQAYPENGVPDFFTTAEQVAPLDHVRMLGALQKHVCGAISKTVNVPGDMPFEDFKGIYDAAYKAGAKGCTTFRPSDKIQGVLSTTPSKKEEGKKEQATPIIPTRPEVLSGRSYKIKSPHMRDAVYVTINDLREGDRVRPFEIFISTKATSHLPWITALSRTVSAVFRHDPCPLFLLEELKSVYDPAGGFYSKGQFVPSLVAEIGNVVERHMRDMGLLDKLPSTPVQGGEECPSCGARALARREGCLTCGACGYSKCG